MPPWSAGHQSGLGDRMADRKAPRCPQQRVGTCPSALRCGQGPGWHNLPIVCPESRAMSDDLIRLMIQSSATIIRKEIRVEEK